ncbi:hypothetical protein QVD17_10514 [Tagetes erecta]|uniref:Uncharacterized protein n=1 Tax=Tagetes erecta TaxID=13708 RepID=A0AAD8L839_TARER|nr:hypothetical protein QVD17_10514 [Tagetes erecta]
MGLVTGGILEALIVRDLFESFLKAWAHDTGEEHNMTIVYGRYYAIDHGAGKPVAFVEKTSNEIELQIVK